MRYLIYFIAIGLSAGLFQQPVGAAYKEINVVGGGTISGKVTIEGGKPRPMAFNLVTIPDPGVLWNHFHRNWVADCRRFYHWA